VNFWFRGSLSLSADSVLVRDEGVAAERIGDKEVVLCLRDDAYFVFNPTGAEIWRILAKPCSVGEMLNILSLSHHVDSNNITGDVMAFLYNLIERRLIRIAQDSEVR
jgi:hypothetical protein